MHKKIRLAPSHHPSSSETMNPSSSFDNYYYSKRSKSKYPVAGTSSSTVKENGNYHIAVDLRSPKNKSKEDDLGERIKYIKSQLTSFTSNNHRSETGSYNNATPARSSVHNVCRSDPRHHSSYGYSSRNYDSNASLSHSFHGLGGTSVMNGYAKSTVTPATQGFSDWLNSTIDSLADPVQTSAVRHGHYPVMTNYSMSCSTGGYATVGFPYQTSYIYYPHHHSVERLLYESFLMQNFDLYVPSSDEAIAEVALLSSTSLTKDKNPVHGGMGHLHSHSTRHRHSHRRQNNEHRNDKRHRRATWRIHYSSDSDVEVINVDDADFSAEYFNEGEPNEEPMENNNNNNDDNNNYSDSDNNNNVNNDNNNNNNNMNINNNNNNNNNNDNGDGNDDDVNSNVSQSFSPPPTNAENDFVPDFDEPTIPWFDQPSFSNYSPEPDDAIEVDKKEDTNETKEENESINVKPQPNGSDPKKRVWECPICFEQNTGQEIVTTMCGHIFCKDCIENYYSTSAHSCPSCRADLRNKPLITLFNF